MHNSGLWSYKLDQDLSNSWMRLKAEKPEGASVSSYVPRLWKQIADLLVSCIELSLFQRLPSARIVSELKYLILTDF